jgi:hypothetical protein
MSAMAMSLLVFMRASSPVVRARILLQPVVLPQDCSVMALPPAALHEGESGSVRSP